MLMTVCMAGMDLAGCGSGSGQGAASDAPQAENSAVESQTEPAADAPAEGAASAEGNVTIWYYWETEGHQEALNHIIDEFNSSNSGVTVEAKYVPFADFKKQLSIGASAAELPDLVLFYNKDMLETAGCEVPASWDELLETAKACTTDTVSGFAHCALQNEEGTFNFLPWMWSTGATSYEINSEGGIKALNFVKDMVDSGAMTKEAINWTQGDTMHQFIAGNLAMMINSTWQIPTMREDAPDVNWGVVPIPKDAQPVSGLGGENYAVIAGGNEEGAIKFLEYAVSGDTCLYMMHQMGYISSDSTIAEGQFEGDEVYQVFVDQMQYAQARGSLPEWPEISDAISLAFNKVITGDSEPEQAAEEAQATIDKIMGEK